MSELDMYFYLRGQQHAERYSDHVPAVGDEVALKDGQYKVTRRRWLWQNLDATVPAVMLEIEPLKNSRA